MKTNISCFSPLFTDLYELTMAAVYFDRQMFAPATFSFFVRRYPPNWRFFLAVGVEDILDYLENFRFSEQDLAYLESLGLFKPEFLDFLKELRFSGQVCALPEGTVFFAEEPVLEVTAPIIEAQLIETFVINALMLKMADGLIEGLQVTGFWSAVAGAFLIGLISWLINTLINTDGRIHVIEFHHRGPDRWV